MAFNKRGPNNFAHWNMFPFMTAPKTQYFLGQKQSPLFRLPREIRNTIYEYYAQGRPQYVYNRGTAKLRYSNTSAQTEGLGLMMTCKIAADEMQHVAFQNVEFTTHCSVDDGAVFQQLRSRVARFCQLFDMVQVQRQYMLICVAELLEASDVTEIRARYPAIEDCFEGPLKQALAQNINTLSRYMNIGLDNHTSQDFIEALVLALDMAKSRDSTKFARLTRGIFGNIICPVGNLRVHRIPPKRLRNLRKLVLHEDFKSMPRSTVRDVIDGTSNISFIGEVGEEWDQEAFFLPRKDWTLDQWAEEWKLEIDPQGFGHVHRTVYNGEVIRSSDRPL
ncbi:uncharacterized protein J4E92_001568 [Alternaria infectoria]|uniref:uncharacterized protein n=1 Tax=Alternaria infectoria TaxID=45303 RepID=UPI002220BB52|nr:uncharacterized protein J4E92_001568 [Alternaria infectoria]KAI4936843.1 hypothetical protein J4E92_001568 [Alternaria infectoria]